MSTGPQSSLTTPVGTKIVSRGKVATASSGMMVLVITLIHMPCVKFQNKLPCQNCIIFLIFFFIDFYFCHTDMGHGTLHFTA